MFMIRYMKVNYNYRFRISAYCKIIRNNVPSLMYANHTVNF